MTYDPTKVKVDYGHVRKETLTERGHRRRTELPVIMGHRSPISNAPVYKRVGQKRTDGVGWPD